MKDAILIIDDENELRKLLVKLLKLEDYTIYDADTGISGLNLLKREDISVVITDVRLPDINGIDLITKIKEINPLCEVIVLTAYGTIEDGVAAIKEGAFDYITKGDEDNKIIPLVHRAVEKVILKRRIELLEKSAGERFTFDAVTGNSIVIREAKELASKVAITDTPVLLLGETGTGKELFAQAIHYSGSRKGRPFVAINCSAFSRDLLESEMFGYKAGAFTGAVKNKKGLFEEAHLGTLFLDEIGELDLSLQAKFLRVLETNDFIKPGDTKPTTVNVRIIAATNRQLEEEVEKRNFRQDLYYRISVLKIELPSLRERKEDLEALSEYFVQQFNKRLKKNVKHISKGFMECIKQYDFPGNIRELRNVIERSMILSDSEILSESTLPKEFFLHDNLGQHKFIKLDDVEKAHILKILESVNGNKTRAAEELGIGLTTLYRKLQSFGIE
ncbi:MAG: sigma-54 dependent transcriptional regulator [Bacteroidota bacterium]|nr:sigma-54 dependent transcriptional regulator [Bacteroidota bacterium]